MEKCPVEGCEYEGTGPRLRLHVERKRDEAHARNRGEMPGEPAAVGGEAVARVEVEESALAVDFGGAVPVAEPLISAEDPGPVVVEETAAAGPGAGREEPASSEEAEAARPIVIEDTAPVGPAAAGAVGHGPAVPTLGQAMESPHLRALVNRFAVGATNRWLIDATRGDTPVTREEIEAVGLPEAIAQTLDWLEKKYGWRFEIDHPLVWWTMVLGMYAQTVSAHRAPRDAGPEDAPADDPGADEKPVEEPRAVVEPVRSDMARLLEALT